MTEVFIVALLLFAGAVCGSFAGAQVWRLRARQLKEDKKNGLEYDKKEYERLTGLINKSFRTDRSQCLNCHKQLAWYDLLPLVSWISTKGKCRYCKKPIGTFEPLIEASLAIFFALLYVLWPYGFDTQTTILLFVLWLIAGVYLAILFAYDAKWFLLPNRRVFPLIGVGALVSIITVATSSDIAGALLGVLGSVAILSGLYLLLWFVSKGKWIGFGDVKLGLGLALLLADWKLAFIALFAANLFGCFIVIPGMLSGKLTRKTHVPFGPLLILGAISALFFGSQIVEWYSASFFFV